MTPEVAAKLQGFGNWEVLEVLATERNHLALSYESRQLVLSGVAQGAQLDASDLHRQQSVIRDHLRETLIAREWTDLSPDSGCEIHRRCTLG